MTLDPATVERTRTTLDASRTRVREAPSESDEASVTQRSSEPDGTLTSAPRSIEVQPATAPQPPLRAGFGRVAIAGGIAAAVLIGVFVGRTVGSGNAVVIAPSSADGSAESVSPSRPVAPAVAVTAPPRDAIAPVPSSSADAEGRPGDPRDALAPASSARARPRPKQGPP